MSVSKLKSKRIAQGKQAGRSRVVERTRIVEGTRILKDDRLVLRISSLALARYNKAALAAEINLNDWVCRTLDAAAPPEQTTSN